MRTVFCPNPACPRGLVRTAADGETHPIGTCPDCGRTLAAAEDLYPESAPPSKAITVALREPPVPRRANSW